MTFRSRVLPPEEWTRLNGTALGLALPRLPPEWCRVVVVEDADGEIIGSGGLMILWHMDGVEIAEAHQKRGVVAERLVNGICRLMREEGVRGAFAVADSDESAELLEKLGAVEVPGRLYAWQPESGVG